MAETDQQLVDQYQATGRQVFLDELLRRHLRPIRNFLFQILLDHHAADDVSQEVFMKIVRSVERFEGRAEFTVWARRIALNAARSYQRSQSRERKRVLHDAQYAPASFNNSPSWKLDQTELIQQLQRSLEQLSLPLREAIVLVCIQEFSPAEAAAIVGCSPNTLYSRLHDARRQLKKLMAEDLQ